MEQETKSLLEQFLSRLEAFSPGVTSRNSDTFRFVFVSLDTIPMDVVSARSDWQLKLRIAFIIQVGELF